MPKACPCDAEFRVLRLNSGCYHCIILIYLHKNTPTSPSLSVSSVSLSLQSFDNYVSGLELLRMAHWSGYFFQFIRRCCDSASRICYWEPGWLCVCCFKLRFNEQELPLWWEVQLRTLSSAQADRAECFSGSCSFYKNSQFPAFPEEEMLKVACCTVGEEETEG